MRPVEALVESPMPDALERTPVELERSLDDVERSLEEALVLEPEVPDWLPVEEVPELALPWLPAVPLVPEEPTPD